MDNSQKKLTDQEKQDELLERHLKNAPKTRVFDIALISAFLLVIFGLGVFIFILPDNEFSEQENRMLAQFPEISDASGGRLGRLFDGSFTRDIAEYYADQMPLRDVFTGFKGIAEIGLLKRENNGVILAKNNFLVNRDTPPDYAQLKTNIGFIEIFAEAMGELGVPVSLAAAPRTMDILAEAGGYLPRSYPTKYSGELWAFYEENINTAENIVNIDLFDTFKTGLAFKTAEELYYKTDHHWTTEGAYFAYLEIMQALNGPVLPLSEITAETASDEFFGTTWSAAGMKWVPPDTLEYYRYPGDENYLTSIADSGAGFDGFYDRDFLETKDKYGSFISGVNTWTEITKKELEPGEPRPKLLLLKDSFAHAAVPFLAYNYDLIILDLRAFPVTGSIAEIIKRENVVQVLFLYNIANFSEAREFAVLLNGLDIEIETEFEEPDVQTEEPELEEGISSRELIDSVMALFGEGELPEGGVEYYFSGVESDSEHYLSGRNLGIILTGLFDMPPEFEYIYDYAFIIPNGYHAFEIGIFMVSENHSDKLETVRALFDERRKNIIAKNIPHYVPAEAWIVDAYRIITVDNYAVLLQTTDNDRAEAVIRAVLSGEEPAVSSAPPPPVSPPEITEPPAVPDPAEPPAVTVPAEPVTVPAATEPPAAPSVPDANVTQDPVLTVRKYSHNTSYILGGICETGAWIEVTGGLHTILTQSNHGDFLVEIPFDGSRRNTTLTLRTFVEGKEPSPSLDILVRPQTGITMFEDSGRFGVVVGYNYFTIFSDSIPDFIGSNLISDRRISELKERTETRIQELRSRGSDAEVIYLLVPNPSRIYPENMPIRYTEFKDDTLKRQWVQGITEGGATVIDLLDTMTRHKNDEFKIFHFTDSHWTEYGAMLAYTDLMNYIAQRFPDAAPRPASDFRVYNRRAYFGDIYKTLDLPKTALREYSAFVDFNFTSPCGKINLYDDVDSVCLVHERISRAQTTMTNLQGNFPKAYIFRDSFAGPIHAFLTDRFSEANWLAMWDYRFRASDIAEFDPDYVIYIISERNIPEMMN